MPVKRVIRSHLDNKYIQVVTVLDIQCIYTSINYGVVYICSNIGYTYMYVACNEETCLRQRHVTLYNALYECRGSVLPLP